MKKKIITIFMTFLVVMLPVSFADALSLTYDANGNLVSGDGLFREYNSLNQLWRVYNGSTDGDPLLQEFTHHPIEERVIVKKTYNSSGSLFETVYYIDENFVRVVNTSGSYDFTYVKHEGSLVAQVNPDNSKNFIHNDHLGSSTVVTDSSGNVIENTSYAPFGEILTGGTSSRFDYEGKEFDSITGQYDFHFRGYRADWGIFTQPDTLIQNVYDPQSLNRYMFERGNPYKHIDEDGHISTWVAAGIVIGGAAGLGFIVGFGGDAWSQHTSQGTIDWSQARRVGGRKAAVWSIGGAISVASIVLNKFTGGNTPFINPNDAIEYLDKLDDVLLQKKEKVAVVPIPNIDPPTMPEQSNAQVEARPPPQTPDSTTTDYTTGGGGWRRTTIGGRSFRAYLGSLARSLSRRGWSPGRSSSNSGGGGTASSSSSSS